MTESQKPPTICDRAEVAAREWVAESYEIAVDNVEPEEILDFMMGVKWQREQSKVLSERIVELEKAIESIDDYIRYLRCDGYISMKQMIEALKVLSDNYPGEK